MTLLQMTGIAKRFPGVQALDGASFSLHAGEVHALMGENGAGKSTLMKILAGIHQPDAGEIRLQDQPIRPASPRAAQDLGISIIHQELALMSHLTVAQNIFIGREPRRSLGRLDEPALRRAAADLLGRMRLRLDPDAEIGSLTIARQQMVEIAKALSFRSRVLIMDEPTAALNDAEIADLFALIRDLKQQGVGIVYITHRMDELARIADRVTVMRDGQTIETLPAAGTPVSRIIQLMVGRALAEAAPRPQADAEGAAPPVLSVQGMRRGTAVRDVSFDLRRGEILGFAGLMGAGRTELARLIFGADRAEAGRILIHGRPVSIRSPRDAVRAGIGYLSEDRKRFGLALGLAVRDNILLASLPAHASRLGLVQEGAMAKAASDLIRRLAIRTPSDRQAVRLLSGGNQQKVVLARWLLRDCEVLIVDEPTRGIDVGAKQEIYALLESLAAAGKALIVISSDLPEVLRISHRIAVMCEGRLTGILPGAPQTTQEAIMALATRRMPESGSAAA